MLTVVSMDTNHSADTAPRKPFAATIQELRGGLLHAELSDALAEVTSAAVEHGKPGVVILKITLKPDGDQMFVTDDVTIKKPQGKRPTSLMFADEGGNLHRRDPRQPELPMSADQLAAQREQRQAVGS